MKSVIVNEDIKNLVEEMKPVAHKLEGKTLLISGGAGFLGRYFLLALDYLNQNVFTKPCRVLCVDNLIVDTLPDFIPANSNFKFIKHDITKPLHVEEEIHFIMHAASIASPVFYNKFKIETIDVGTFGTKNLLELAREKKVESFLMFSSSEIYGDPYPQYIPTPESYLGNVSCVGPRACYDEPKRIAETMCMSYHHIFKVPIKIVRPFNVFGPGMKLDDMRVVANFVASGLRGENLPVHGNGLNTRTFCYISDAIVQFFLIMLSDYEGEIFNVGNSDHEITMMNLAKKIADDFGVAVNKIEQPLEVYMKSNPQRRCPDLTKLKHTFSYSSKIDLDTGIQRFIEWAKEYSVQTNFLVERK